MKSLRLGRHVEKIPWSETNIEHHPMEKHGGGSIMLRLHLVLLMVSDESPLTHSLHFGRMSSPGRAVVVVFFPQYYGKFCVDS